MYDEIITFLRARLTQEEEAWRAGTKVAGLADLAWGCLDDVAAKRAIIAEWPDTMGAWSAEAADAARELKSRILRHLASSYAKHPDYKQEWAL